MQHYTLKEVSELTQLKHEALKTKHTLNPPKMLKIFLTDFSQFFLHIDKIGGLNIIHAWRMIAWKMIVVIKRTQTTKQRV